MISCSYSTVVINDRHLKASCVEGRVSRRLRRGVPAALYAMGFHVCPATIDGFLWIVDPKHWQRFITIDHHYKSESEILNYALNYRLINHRQPLPTNPNQLHWSSKQHVPRQGWHHPCLGCQWWANGTRLWPTWQHTTFLLGCGHVCMTFFTHGIWQRH